MVDKQNLSLSEMGDDQSMQQVPQVVHNNINLASGTIPVAVNNVSCYINASSDYDSSVNYASSRKHERQESSIPLLDVDEDKYRTKSPMEFLSRWFRYFSTAISILVLN